ncbi:MAG: hypothetical protein SOV63_02820 [Pyramidobacter porci]|uniref:hypothetical protein n=1 Tax=Pyramidobacter porci TaxID=2605789 RepID=UPI002A758DA1|nr:hypothetical protein [Pyramidobacter porci]MDY2647719.1 hypothetical protein [Pyramidobacter porci]
MSYMVEATVALTRVSMAAALAGEGRIEGDGQKSAFGHGLGVQPAGLLLDGAEGTADGEGGKLFAAAVLGNVHVGGQSDAVTVFEEDFFVLHFLAFGENLVPFLFQLRRGGRCFRREGGSCQRHGAEERAQGEFFTDFHDVFSFRMPARCAGRIVRRRTARCASFPAERTVAL